MLLILIFFNLLKVLEFFVFSDINSVCTICVATLLPMTIDYCSVFLMCELYLSSTLENYQSFVSSNTVFVTHLFSPLIKLILALFYLFFFFFKSLLVIHIFCTSFSLYAAFWVTSYGLFSTSVILSFALFSLLLNILEFLNLDTMFLLFFSCIL